jgi:biopolymer transport protein ExbB/TolQ
VREGERAEFLERSGGTLTDGELSMTSYISGFFLQGGFWMWPILAAQIVSVALIVERCIALYTRRTANARSRARLFEEDIRRGQMERVLKRTEGQSDDVVAVMARTGAESVMHSAGKEEIQLRMEELILEENSRIENRLGFLPTLANVATLMGLLGTIVGLIQSFAAISNANGAEKARLLADGVSVAMNTTAYGLIVAVPALVMYAVLQNRANKLMEDLQKASLRMFIWFGFNVEKPARSSRGA